MPATAGRVRMPANNRVHSSAALQTHGIWQSAIGYDPYAPDQKGGGGGGAAAAGAGGGGGSAAVDGDNAYDSFQGLLQLAKLTGSNADEARGACRKCHRVGHLTFQCRNFLTAKEDLQMPADVAANGLKGLGGARPRSDKKAGGEDIEEDDETDVSDSSEDSDRERRLGEVARMRGLMPKKGKKDSVGGPSDAKRSLSSKSKEKRRKKQRSPETSSESDSSESSEEERRKSRSKDRRKRREMVKRRSKSSDDESSDDSDSGGERRRRKRTKSKSRRKHRESSGSESDDETSESDRAGRRKRKSKSKR